MDAKDKAQLDECTVTLTDNDEGSVLDMPMAEAARMMGLDEAELESTLDQFGRCDVDQFTATLVGDTY